MKALPILRAAGLAKADTADFVSLARSFTKLLILFFALLGIALPSLTAAILPPGVLTDPDHMYEKGYLNVKYYGVLPGASAATNTAGINQALADAYNFGNAQTKLNASTFMQGSLVVYFEAGTYNVDDTLQAWTATEPDPTAPSHSFATPENHLAIVGATTGARPKIKLVPSDNSFNLPGSPKVLLDFRNFDRTGHATMNTGVENASEAYHQMLRGIDLECTTGARSGAIALYFNQAQDSSVENVSIDVTGASTGILGLPGRGWGAVNISVTGGDYGIDFFGTGSAGTTIAGVVLTNQVVSAVRFQGFCPLTIVGFNITAPAGQANAALEVLGPGPTNEYDNIINLVDGRIQLNNTTAAAIDNQVGASLYLKNVYVKGTKHMVRTPSGETDSSAAADPTKWQRINEYGYNNQVTGQIDGNDADKVDDVPPLLQDTRRSVNGAFSALAETKSFTPNDAAGPAGNIVNKHVWGKLPAVDDADAYNPVDAGQINLVNGVANVSASTLNTILTNHDKVFLPKGIYRINGTITIPSNHVLFGAARHLTRIEVQQGDVWVPTVETAMITTSNDAAATTYFGDITIGVDTFDTETSNSHDWFTALWWRAGGDSMVHMGQPYRWPTSNNNAGPTRAHSLIKITGSGGGRWYFAGSRKTGKSDDPGFRILRVEGVSNASRRTEPLWFYGLNPEHPRGPDHYVEFRWTNNVRIYGGKTEYSVDPAQMGKSAVIRFDLCDNIELYGMGALRNGLENDRGNIEFFDCTNVLATAINPQRDDLENAGARTLLEKTGGVATRSLAYPHIVSLYRKGSPTETPMVHIFTSY